SAAAESPRLSVVFDARDGVDACERAHGGRRQGAIDGRNALVSSDDLQAATLELGHVGTVRERDDDRDLTLRLRTLGLTDTLGQLVVDLRPHGSTLPSQLLTGSLVPRDFGCQR